MSIKVYHIEDEAFFNVPQFATRERLEIFARQKWPGSYTLVAAVEARSLDDAFRLTNTIDNHWTKNPGVVVEGDCSKRSTSVGDVLQTDDGGLWAVASVGFAKLEVAS